jgi:pyruvate dehydrogenase E2 component (dihydrolipoamide acetyltransferase)
MPDLLMPRLSDSMEEGTILNWLKAAGETVRRGEEIVEIETDKATMTYEADADGVLEIVAAVGETLPIGAVIARIGADSTNPQNGAQTPAPPAAVQGTPPVVAAPAQAAPTQAQAAPTQAQPAPATRIKASPVARRIARERGVDLGALSGTGPGGRIVREDVERADGAPQTQTAPPAEALPAPHADPLTAKGETSLQELTKTQQVVARRMAQAKATVPEFTLDVDIDMERCVELRAQLRELAADGEAIPSYNDMIIRACALALREHPRANAAYKDGRFELYGRVNVGVAVAAQDALVVPTVFDADTKRLPQIAAETRALAERVRAGTITPPELSGGTFTVSNLGMFGIDRFTAIINPPQAAILAVGAIVQRAVAHDGELALRHRLAATLACDHRILYGADAAIFLGRIRALLEQPLALLV